MGERANEPELRRMLTELCRRDVSQLDLDCDLTTELGLDSLAGLRVLAGVEKRFEVRFPDHQLAEFRTMRQILQFINQAK